MSTPHTNTPHGGRPTPELLRIGTQTFVAVTTFRKSGAHVTTPMHVVEHNGRLFFRTYSAAGKAKRLNRNPEITVGSSDIRGKATGTPVDAIARRLNGEDEAVASRALRHKYPISQRIIPLYHRLRGWKTYHYEILPRPITIE